MRKITTFAGSTLIFCAIWQVIAMTINNAGLFPPVWELCRQIGLLLLTADFYHSVLATVMRGIAGMFLSHIAATLTAVLCHRYTLFGELFRPVLSIIRSVPVISFILLALMFLHPESIPLLIGFLSMYPLLTENLIKGLQTLHPAFTTLSHQFRLSKANHFTQVIYPQVKPYLFSGLASAMGFGWRAIVMGEVLSQCRWGIGSRMKEAQVFIEIPQLLAWTAIAILLSFLADRLITRLGKYRIPIHYSGRRHRLTRALQPIQVNDLAFSYGEEMIIDHFTATFPPDHITGISGPSGKGKTTLLNLINGELTPLDGKIEINRDYPLANVFQEPLLLPHLSVSENISLVLAAQTDRAIIPEKVKDILTTMELSGLAMVYPNDLSSGQRQRVSIARALAYPAPVLLMDEPFKGLEKRLVQRIITWIREQHKKEHQIIIFTSHQPDELESLAGHIITLTP